jgi:hypothetical protein
MAKSIGCGMAEILVFLTCDRNIDAWLVGLSVFSHLRIRYSSVITIYMVCTTNFRDEITIWQGNVHFKVQSAEQLSFISLKVD